MTSQGPLIVGSGSSSASGVAWTNPGNITADDATYAVCVLTAGQFTQQLNGTMGSNVFSIPAGATINGIVVEIQLKSVLSNTIIDASIKLTKNGTTAIGTNKGRGVGVAWPTTETYISYGTGTTDLWGSTWSVSEINSANFGCILTAGTDGPSAGTADVDDMRITVYYTAAASQTPDMWLPSFGILTSSISLVGY